MAGERKITRAVISVTDKTGIDWFAQGLEDFGISIISTGGTAKKLRDCGVGVTEVADVTGFPEMLDGRVKTIHPKVAAGILADRGKAEHMAAIAAQGIGPIDMVVVNLYAFERAASKAGITVQQLIEEVDIGGPTMIRAAAKNFESVAVVVDPGDYAGILGEMGANNGALSMETRWKLAQKAFDLTAAYDRAISNRLKLITCADGQFEGHVPDALPACLDLRIPKLMGLRYGENSHQQAALYSFGDHGIAGAQQLGGKELSYNNLVDADAAWQLVREFAPDLSACAIIKHTNPCGCAVQPTLVEAYLKALECDPVSAFGSVIAFNQTVDLATATELAKLFVEVVIAPAYAVDALAVLVAKKSLRILKVTGTSSDGLVIKSISGGYLAQTPDVLLGSEVDDAVLMTKREPTAEEWRALRFAWRVVKHVKSNAIVYAREGQLLGLGAGQPNRVNSAIIGAQFAVLPLRPCVVGSDAFFPFPDGVEEAIKNGATAIVQPGGSKNDQLAVDAADKAGIAMVFTGVRHFRH